MTGVVSSPQGGKGMENEDFINVCSADVDCFYTFYESFITLILYVITMFL
jgi:hypothetical protein